MSSTWDLHSCSSARERREKGRDVGKGGSEERGAREGERERGEKSNGTNSQIEVLEATWK
jgi:hypothetical protein